jgi:quercetin dioxygenase-like cupin family protein
MIPYKVDFGQVPWESPMRGLRFKAVRQAGRQLRLVEYTKEMEPHWCEKGHIGYVLEGRFEIRFPGEVHSYDGGDGIFIPAGVEHKHMGKALTDVVQVVFVEDV